MEANGFDFQDIWSGPLSPEQLEELRVLAGSYQALFSRRARKYREWGLQDRELGEKGLPGSPSQGIHLFETA